MPRIWLIAWNAGEAADRAKVLRGAGFTVDMTPFSVQQVREPKKAPDAFVIDLSRAPSRGRDTGLFLRQRASTRRVPLVFVGGEAEAARAARAVLRDAVFTTWAHAAAATRAAIAHPPASPIVPGVFAPFAGTALWKKIGIKANTTVVLVNAPLGFEKILGSLPPGVRLGRGFGDGADLTLWFVRDRQELESNISRMTVRAAGGGLWIFWPKRRNGAAPDVDQILVRKTGLANGLVDFKITAMDPRWSGLRFTQRRRA